MEPPCEWEGGAGAGGRRGRPPRCLLVFEETPCGSLFFIFVPFVSLRAKQNLLGFEALGKSLLRKPRCSRGGRIVVWGGPLPFSHGFHPFFTE